MTSVYAALAAVMADVGHVAKRDINRSQNFAFRGIDAVVNAVGPALRKHGVIVVPRVNSVAYDLVQTTTGKPMTACRVRVTYVFIGPEGDVIEASVIGEAWDSGDKSSAQAMSVAFRIALLQALALPTDEPDPDSQSYERAHQEPVRGYVDPHPPPLAAAKARAWNAAKALWPDATDDERLANTDAALASAGVPSRAQADTANWNELAEAWEVQAK